MGCTLGPRLIKASQMLGPWEYGFSRGFLPAIVVKYRGRTHDYPGRTRDINLAERPEAVGQLLPGVKSTGPS